MTDYSLLLSATMVLLALGGVVWKLQSFIENKNSKLNKKIEDNMQSLTTLNNTMTSALQLSEMRIVEKFEPDIKALDRGLSDHRFYSEQTYLSKNSFREVMKSNADDRKEFRDEVIGRFDKIDKKLDRKANEDGKAN